MFETGAPPHVLLYPQQYVQKHVLPPMPAAQWSSVACVRELRLHVMSCEFWSFERILKAGQEGTSATGVCLYVLGKETAS